jgi:DNA (cytosine-5)-methyltransferase 1
MENYKSLGMRVKEKQVRGNTGKSYRAVDKPALSQTIVTNRKIYEIAGKIIKTTMYGPDNYRSGLISHYVHTRNETLRVDAIRFTKELLEKHLIGEFISEQLAEEAIDLLFGSSKVRFPKKKHTTFTFIDLFAGIGGFRIAMQNNGGECVFTSEWDKMAQLTYYENFGEIPFGDITKEETKKWIPEKFDVLCGGFPCQPFSIAGVVKKNSLGKKHGFDDEKQGNLFFHIADIIKNHRPKAFFLENVKNLISHDQKRTFAVIKEKLESIGYSFYHKVLDGKHFVPQHRQRTFMVGFDKEIFYGKEHFEFPPMPKTRNANLADIIEKGKFPKYTLSDKLWRYLQDYSAKHKEKGNGFGFGLINPQNPDAYTRTISARYYKDGAEVLVPQKGLNPRRLIPRECARLQGYPEKFDIPVSDNQAYKQFGNSVVVPLIQAIGKKVAAVITQEK